jgi:hypothetical protein
VLDLTEVEIVLRDEPTRFPAERLRVRFSSLKKSLSASYSASRSRRAALASMSRLLDEKRGGLNACSVVIHGGRVLLPRQIGYRYMEVDHA